MDIKEYKLTEKTLQLWQIQLEACDVLLDFCHKNNLKIFAGFGTLLGAARHKGFIPWDDDVDFIMMRDDYDKLMKIVETNNPLPYPYSFDNADISTLRLRRNDTTMTIPGFRWGVKMNNGVWIDIFPLDVAPDDLTSVEKEYTKLKTSIRAYQNAHIRSYAACKGMINKLKHFLLKFFFFFFSIEKHRSNIENHLRRDANRYSGNKLWPYLCWIQVRTVDKVPCYDSSWFSETVFLPFEDRQFPCPKGYEKVLESQYGDWCTPVIGDSLHVGATFVPNQPFDKYLGRKLKEMSLFKRFLYTH